MNRLLVLVSLLFAYMTSGAQQNHVPNGDFEYYDACPSGLQQTTYIKGWRPYTVGTPDYFNTCATYWGVSVPYNYNGFQQAASGQGYVGVYAANGKGEYKEYVTREIIPLTPNGEYEVSLSLSLCDTSDTAESDIGVFFYKSGPTYFNADSTPPVKPQVIYTSYGYLEDQVNWMRLTSTFIADSAYDNIVIGSFKDSNSRTIFEPFPPGTSIDVPYYYIDSVVVRLLDTFKVEFKDTLLCAGDAIQVKYWTRLHTQPGSVFTAELSDANGSFAQPVVIGSDTGVKGKLVVCNIPSNIPSGSGYRIRGVTTYQSEVSIDNGVDVKIVNVDNLTASNNGPVCSNDTLFLAVTSDTSGATYSWTGPGFGSVKQNPVRYDPVKADAGDYIVTAKIYRCTRSDTTTVEVLDGNRARNVHATSNSPVCERDTLLLHGAVDTGSFVYAWAGPAAFAESGKETFFIPPDTTASGKYIFSVTDNECVVSDTADVVVNLSPFKPVLSSNGPVGIGEMVFLKLENPTPGSSIQWTGPGGFKSSSPTPSIGNATTAHSGKYILTTERNGCTDSSSIDIYVYDIKDTGRVILYPNPNNGTFTLEGLMYNDNTIPIAIYSSMGIRVHKQDIKPVNKAFSEKVTLEGRLASGVYFAELVIDRQEVVIPFTVSR